MKSIRFKTSLIALFVLAFFGCNSNDNNNEPPKPSENSEYISYKLDSGSTVYLVKHVSFNYSYRYDNQTTIYNYEGYGNQYYMTFNSIANTPGVYKYPNFYVRETTIPNGPKITDDITFTINKFGNQGEYVDIDYSGTYEDSQKLNHQISGKIHVLKWF